MSWKIIIANDPDTTGEKTATAIWTEVDGREFIHTVRGKATTGAVNAFVASAIASRNAWQAANTIQATQEANVLAKLNAADPQGVK